MYVELCHVPVVLLSVYLIYMLPSPMFFLSFWLWRIVWIFFLLFRFMSLVIQGLLARLNVSFDGMSMVVLIPIVSTVRLHQGTFRTAVTSNY